MPENRFYIADAGFGARDGIVVPFPGIRYHQGDWVDADVEPTTRRAIQQATRRDSQCCGAGVWPVEAEMEDRSKGGARVWHPEASPDNICGHWAMELPTVGSWRKRIN